MGRIQKKKDPEKKKAQIGAGSEKRPSASKSGAESGPSKPLTVLKKPAGSDKPKKSAHEQNFLQKSVQFYREVKIELKKVTWPTRKQTMGSTVVVLILVAIISLFLGLVDLSLSSLVRVVLP